ncbi:hypothetical protein BGX38DRAFT_380118 [Terfezia claveryi]|nr:hypothetical protein BGX38DRAFT_380118 [Terfezia claveryi]
MISCSDNCSSVKASRAANKTSDCVRNFPVFRIDLIPCYSPLSSLSTDRRLQVACICMHSLPHVYGYILCISFLGRLQISRIWKPRTLATFKLKVPYKRKSLVWLARNLIHPAFGDFRLYQGQTSDAMYGCLQIEAIYTEFLERGGSRLCRVKHRKYFRGSSARKSPST